MQQQQNEPHEQHEQQPAALACATYVQYCCLPTSQPACVAQPTAARQSGSQSPGLQVSQ